MNEHNNDKPPVPIPMGKDEMNLVEFPITLLSKRDLKKVKTLEFSDTIYGEGNKMMKREWIVTGSDKFGLPLADDNDVLLAILQIGKETDFETATVNFSRYRLCKMIGLKPGGSGYRRIERALDRLVGVRIKAKNAFWDNRKKGYVTVNFGILESYSLFNPASGGEKKAGTGVKQSLSGSVTLNTILFQSIKSGYIKNMDLTLYFGLKSVISKRLYRYLDKKRYKKTRFEINLFTLAFEHLGLSRSRPYASQIKQCLDPAHKELVKSDFLKATAYEKTADGKSEKVVYSFHKKDIRNDEIPASFEHDYEMLENISPEDVTIKTEEETIIETLMSNGVSAVVAKQLLRNYSVEKILGQIDILPFREARDPAAVLVKSIQYDWSPPTCYQERQKQDKDLEVRKKKQRKEEEEKSLRRKKVDDYLSALSQKEEQYLRTEAEDMAREEGSIIFKDKDIPDFMIKSYMYVIAEKKLGIEK